MRDPGPPTRLDRPIPIDYGDDDRARFPAPPPPPLRRGRDGGDGGEGGDSGDDGDRFHLGPRELRVLALIAGLAVVVAILVLPPVSLLSRGGGSDARQGVVTRERGSIPALPAGLEAASGLYDIDLTRDVPSPLNFTVRLSNRSTDNRNLAFYTYHENAWHRLTSVATTDDGSGAIGQLETIPANIAVLRRAALAHAFAAIIAPGETPDPATRDASIISVLAGEPVTGDEGLQLSDKLGANLQGKYLGITISTATAAASVNRILGDLAATRRHIDAIAAAADTTRAAGVHIDYLGINANRRATFSAFVQQLRDRLKQANRGLVVTVPALPGNDPSAYDWVALSAASDAVWLRPPGDPAAYYDTLETLLRTRREAGVDLSRVSLVLSRRSHERSGDLIRALTLRDAMTTASALRPRVDQGIGVGDPVILSGTNIDQDTGNSGLRWDDRSRTVSFAYASRTGARTVWLENRFSTAFRLDLARRYNLGGVVIDGAVQDEALPDIWNVVLAWASDNVIHLELPYGPYLQPTWRSNEGQVENTPASGAVVWRAPTRPGVYEVTLVVSDGVIFIGQRLSLRVTLEGARTPTPTPAATPGSTATPTSTSTPARTPTPTATRGPG